MRYRKIFSIIQKVNIQVKITVLFFVLLMTFSYLISMYLTYNIDEKAFNIAQQYVKGLPKLIENSINEHMITGDRSSIKRTIASVIDDKVVLGVHIFDSKGNLSCGCMSSKINKSICNINKLNFSEDYISAIHKNFEIKQVAKKISTKTKKFIAFYNPYLNGSKCKSCHERDGKILGVLNVNIDVTEIISFFDNKVKLVKRLMILFSIFMTAILSFLVNYLIVNPIRKLEKGMELVTAGNLDTEINIDSRDELEKLSDYFNQMVYSLKKANQQIDKMHRNIIHSDRLMTIGQLMASISHEIKNPLNSIMLTADILQIKCAEYEKEQELIKHLDNIIQDTSKIRDIIDQTLSFSKATIKVEEICADEFMESLEIYAKRIIFYNSDIGFSVQKLDNFCKYKIKFNRVSLEQIFINILKNSVEAIEEGKKGFINVNVEYVEDYLLFTIEDNGKGIEPEQMKYLFKEFYTTKPNGTGLGLSIAKNLLEEFNGNIFIESEVGKGTKVTIKLPVIICEDNKSKL